LEHSEATIEKQIQAKGLTAPRLTPAVIDGAISSEQYYVPPGTTLTLCTLILRNGFTVTGESAAASPENFDAEIGRKIARENARQKIWALEGYLLKQWLYDQTSAVAKSSRPGNNLDELHSFRLRSALAELADVVRVVATDVALPKTERTRLDAALAAADHLTGVA